ncbi:serine/threonine-protein kinase PLK1-like [Anneissia japonica]|uniref:serine/threonine-protein kinase PLK1-like n=1 Tax=Anneissia japonica TaxID=1529436 RepID=UPI00142550B9|nr:serine/threonine-protein kinase PLK1-like [Anneissia japonica]
MASKKEDLRVKDVPDIIVDPSSRKRYMKGRFLGKGGFAKCYELTDVDTKQIYAGKIVSKALLVKPHQKEKMSMEIAIHRSLNHRHVVGFHGFFEDDNNVYILLEICRRRSLMELHKRRKAITEPEARFFMHQTISGVQYLHKTKVIHRDLKLGNLFINDEMEIKLGDFGLATKIDFEGERKRTLCGTPNYIAPEVLAKKGHSFEVDTWSLGCIMYTLLVGKPPFETSSLKDTYMRIKKNEYYIPSKVSSCARSLIQRLLKNDPSLRPSVETLLHDEFFTSGYMPPRLPTSCLTMAPRFANNGPAVQTRKPLLELNSAEGSNHKEAVSRKSSKPDCNKPSQPKESEGDEPTGDYYLDELLAQLNSLLHSKAHEIPDPQLDEAEDPAAIPILWVSKWVDYSDKYGLGYQLCDGSVGVLFNDSTRLLLNSDGENVQYIEREGQEFFHTLKSFPQDLTKKITLLKYFRNYMSEHLLKAGGSMTPREPETMARLPWLRSWFRTRSAIVLHLTNGTLQINFFLDHTKIILCPLMAALTYIDEKRNFRTFRMKQLEQSGCNKELLSRVRYARTMVERLMTSRFSGKGKTSTTATS